MFSLYNLWSMDPIMASPGVYDLNKLKSPLPETVPHKRQFVSFSGYSDFG